MKRRNYIIASGGIVSGAILGSRTISQDTLAADYNLAISGENEFDYEDEIGFRLNFDRLVLDAGGGIDKAKDLKMRLYAKREDESEFEEISSKEYDISRDSIDVSDTVNASPLQLTNNNTVIDEDIDELDGGTRESLNYDIMVEFEWDEVVVESQVEDLELTIRREIIERLYDDEEEQDFETEILEDDVQISDDEVILRVEPDTAAAFDGNLDEDNFTISESEDGEFRKQDINVTDLSEGSDGESTANLIFNVDKSGSVSDEEQDIKDAISDFAEELGDDYNYALSSFWDGSRLRGENLGEYDDADDFIDTVNEAELIGSSLDGSLSDSFNVPEDQFESFGSDLEDENYLIMLGDGDHFDTSYTNDDFTIISIYFDGSGDDPQDMAAVADYTDDEDPNETNDKDKELYFDTRDNDGDYGPAFQAIREVISGEYELLYEPELDENEERDILIQVFDGDDKSETTYTVE